MGARSSRTIRNYCSLHEFQRPTSRKCHVRWCEHLYVLPPHCRKCCSYEQHLSFVVLYLSALVAYFHSAVPRLQQFAVLPPFARNLPTFPPHLKDPTVELASSHLVVSVALTGVMILQAARYWVEGEDAEAAAKNTTFISDSAESDSSHGWKRSPRPSGLEPKSESSPARTSGWRKKVTTGRRKPVSKGNGVL